MARSRKSPAPGSVQDAPPASRSTARPSRSRSRPTRRCSRCCARTWASPAPSTAASSASAAPAPCSWTASPCSPASCSALECEGRAVETVEGMAGPGGLHPLQKAFADLGAAQCGYCTPGIPADGEGAARGEPEADARRDPRGARRESLPLHRLHQDLRGGRARRRVDARRGGRAAARVALRLRLRRERAAASPSLSARRGRGQGEGGRVKRLACKTRVIGRPYAKVDAAREGHRPDEVRRRRDAAAHAALQAAALDDRARAHRLDRRLAGARGARASSRSRPARTCRSPSASCRSPRTSTRSAPTASASSAIRSPAVAAVDEDAAFDALDLIDVEYEPLPPIGTIDEGLAPAGAADPRLRRPRQHPQARRRWSSATRRRASARRRPRLRGPLLLRGQHAPRRSSSTPRSPTSGRTASSRSGPRRRRRTTCTARSRRCSEMPAAQIRVIATPNGGGFGGKRDPFNHEIVVAHLSRVTGPPGQDLPDARGGLLLPPRPPSGADAGARPA